MERPGGPIMEDEGFVRKVRSEQQPGATCHPFINAKQDPKPPPTAPKAVNIGLEPSQTAEANPRGNNRDRIDLRIGKSLFKKLAYRI